MTEIRHVLCPVDFSDFSRRALDHAIRFLGSTAQHLVRQAVCPVLTLRDSPAAHEEVSHERS